MDRAKIALVAIVGVLGLVVIGVAGWQFGWWLEGKNTDRRVQIENRNKGSQTAWADEARNAISDYELTDPSNTAARGALRNKACVLIERLTYNYRDEDLQTFHGREC